MKNYATLWMRTQRPRKVVADATALRRECAPRRTLSYFYVFLVIMRFSRGLFSRIFLNPAVPYADHPLGLMGNPIVMGDQNNRSSILMQFL